MAVADAASVRTVAVQLRALSADPDNQPIIAREDGCLRALISFVHAQHIPVATIAVAAIRNLSSHPDNRDLLRSEHDLLDALKNLLLANDADRDLRQTVFDVLEQLVDESDDDEMDELDDLEQQAGLREKTTSEPGLMDHPSTVRLHIHGISDELLCVRVEQLVIRTRGVISVAFELGAEVAVIYTRTTAEHLISYLSTMTGVKVQQLEDPPEEEHEEDTESEKENDTTQPAYLDQSGQRLRDVAKKNAKKKHTITQGASSLHERLRAQREEESRKKARANRLLDSIGRGMTSGWGLW
ncbi:Armadillo repeat-containing protein 1 [Gracilariopsis chorda]|uniref:Armadillo repeat-containing protein 1 n=1 Tax=Gracilariopsis chorda TaxID=448386 RepID=A0A2V3IWL2_9FLOR|nr:Armadillo repeat-containing protein 1 [Gracilariopsis chorda]|eukprot:PXF46534.1 Armadillo repeat-containing protein 1 [Gracilariopsis chorda]